MIYQQRDNDIETDVLDAFIKRLAPDVASLGADQGITRRALEESKATDAMRSTPQTRDRVRICQADADRVEAKHRHLLTDLDTLRAELVSLRTARARTCNAGVVAAKLTSPFAKQAWVYASQNRHPHAKGAA